MPQRNRHVRDCARIESRAKKAGPPGQAGWSPGGRGAKSSSRPIPLRRETGYSVVALSRRGHKLKVVPAICRRLDAALPPVRSRQSEAQANCRPRPGWPGCRLPSLRLQATPRCRPTVSCPHDRRRRATRSSSASAGGQHRRRRRRGYDVQHQAWSRTASFSESLMGKMSALPGTVAADRGNLRQIGLRMRTGGPWVSRDDQFHVRIWLDRSDWCSAAAVLRQEFRGSGNGGRSRAAGPTRSGLMTARDLAAALPPSIMRSRC